MAHGGDDSEEALTWDGQDGCREPTNEDLADLCGWLNNEQARYVVVGGFAIRAAGYVRCTMDVDLLIEATSENEARVYRALANLPDGIISEVEIGDVARYGVVRIGDEIMVDLMKDGCGIGYRDAIADARFIEMNGVTIPFASPSTLWRMKQTVREKDIPDRLFLRQWAQAEGVTLDPPPSPPAQTIEIPGWVPVPIRKVLLRWFGCSPSV